MLLRVVLGVLAVLSVQGDSTLGFPLLGLKHEVAHRASGTRPLDPLTPAAPTITLHPANLSAPEWSWAGSAYMMGDQFGADKFKVMGTPALALLAMYYAYTQHPLVTMNVG
eukprot:c26749_g1_i1.p1 GENE.c26749_g1_i1~~c26749_g1_i1.p1  ORF type:complete len:111 (+),score=20.19 c26749_g1_i1:38-370(+)